MKLNTENLQIHKIGNIRLLYYPHKSYLSNIRILTAIGSSAEEKNNQGMAHILEHMFFKGSIKRPGGKSISRAANDIGGKMNAYTSYDHTVYYITVLNEVFAEGFDILTDMYLNPLFPKDEFAKELNPILSELRETEDDPESYLLEKAFQAFFGDNYHPIIGTEKSIRSANVDMMHNFKNDFYGGENCLISVVGGISLDEVLKCVNTFCITEIEVKKASPKKIENNSGKINLKKPGIREAYCSFLFPALDIKHPDRFKQDMMNYLLGGNDSALLFERIREELGMSCYGIYSWILRSQPYSCLSINCGIAPEEIEQLEEEIKGQIKIISEKLLDQERLERGKASLRTSIAAKAETSSGLNSIISLPILQSETENPIHKILNQLEKISLDDILESAKNTFQGPMLQATLSPE